jgi:peptidoglycan/LPS O-acetylase OafA/YrhL
MRYIKGLDTVRAVAVCLVIFWHWYPQYPIFSFKGVIQHVFIPTGETGVTLFFVLSGFLITSILLRAKSENDNNLLTIKNFVIRRALRIFPIYYILIGLLILLGYPFENGALLYHLTYTTNFYIIKEGHWTSLKHIWSLAVEEQFYLIWPWLILYTKDKYLKYVFFSSIIIAIVSVIFSVEILHMRMAYTFTPTCFDAFGMGGLYAYCQLNASRYAKFKEKLKIAVPIAFVIYFTWKLVPYFGLFPKYIFFQRTIDSVLSIWVIDLVITNKSTWFKTNILENRLLNKIGKISYGLYLFHDVYPYFLEKIFQYLIEKFPLFKGFLSNVYTFRIVSLVTLFIIASLSFELIEKRITNFKNRFDYKNVPEISPSN